MEKRLEDPRATFGAAEAVLKQKAEEKIKLKPSALIRLTIKQWCAEVERAKRAFEKGQTELVETSLRLAESYHKTLTLYVYQEKSAAQAAKAAMVYMENKYGKSWGTA
jgi:hypothetical protein